MHLKSWRIDMTREEAKQLLPIIQAFAEGKAIESRCIKGDKSLWYDDEDPSFDDDLEYRIKPEPTYRPFKNAEECWQEMQKHQLFGWVKIEDLYRNIANVTSCSITFADNEARDVNYEQAFKNYTFTDGTPFGVKEET